MRQNSSKSKKAVRKVKSEYIDPKTLAVLLETMRPENALALKVSFETGLRIGDVLTLRRGDINGGEVRKRASKTGKISRSKISAQTAASLERLRGEGEWYFPGGGDSGHRTRQAVWRDVRNATRRLSVKQHVSPHSARKTFAVEHFKRDGLERTQDLLQHDNVSTTLLYALADKLKPGGGDQSGDQITDSRLLRFFELLVTNLGGASAVERALLITLKTMLKELKSKK